MSVESFLQREMDRRELFKAALLVGGGLVTTIVMGSTLWQNREMRLAAKRNWGKYLKSTEGRESAITDTPVILHVELLPFRAGRNNQEEILLRREPHLSIPLIERVPAEVNIVYAVPVFGEGFSSRDNNKGMIFIPAGDRRQYMTGGQWLMLADKDGHPVDQAGQQLNEGEKPFYTSNGFKILP